MAGGKQLPHCQYGQRWGVAGKAHLPHRLRGQMGVAAVREQPPYGPYGHM